MNMSYVVDHQPDVVKDSVSLLYMPSLHILRTTKTDIEELRGIRYMKFLGVKTHSKKKSSSELYFFKDNSQICSINKWYSLSFAYSGINLLQLTYCIPAWEEMCRTNLK